MEGEQIVTDRYSRGKQIQMKGKDTEREKEKQESKRSIDKQNIGFRNWRLSP